MTRVVKILEILEIYFQRGHKGLSIFSDKPPNPYLEEVKEKIIGSYEHPENIKFTELIQKTIEIVKDDKEVIIEKISVEESPLFDRDLYEKINPILIDLSKDYPDQFKFNTTWFLSTQEGMFSYVESIMLIREEILNFKTGFEKVSEISSIIEKIISKINNLDFKDFKLYLKDWILKLSDLIESEFKRTFKFLNLFWRLELNQESVLDKLKNKSIGYIYRDMAILGKYANIDRIRVYRNKTYHSNIKYINKDKWGNRRIRLRKNINLSVVDIIIDFLKVFLFITTFILMIYNRNMVINGITNEDRLIDKL